MKVYHGDILSVNKEDEVFQYLVEDQGKIVYVGNRLPVRFDSSKCIELGERCLVPAFVDSHQHFASFALFNSGLNVMEASSNKEIQMMIKKYLKDHHPKVLIAFGASSHSVEEGCLINREMLDEVCGNACCMVVKYDGHAAIINSCLLKKMKKHLVNLRGYHEDSGEMNQEAFFELSKKISMSVPLPQLFKQMDEALKLLASKGIGCIHSVSGVGFPLNIDLTLECIYASRNHKGMMLRVFPQSLDIGVAKRRGLKRIGGCFACALDGCFGSEDAALNENYIGKNDRGVLYYSDEIVYDFVKKAHLAGMQIEMHAIGDAAFDQATRIYKKVLDEYPRKDHRHGIIHACLCTKEGLDICEKYGIQLLVQTAFNDWKQEPESYLKELLGKNRYDLLNPISEFSNRHIMFSAGSDGPCTLPDPLEWMKKATGLTPQEKLRMVTYNGAYATFDENIIGSLEIGKKANMVVLSKNPYENNLDDVKVEKLILEGEVYD